MLLKNWLIGRTLALFRIISGVSGWFETRFTTNGRILLGAALIAAIFGIDPRQTLALHLAAVLFGLIVVAIAASLHWRPRLDITRNLPQSLTTETAASYLLSISNRGGRAEQDLVVADRLLTRYPTVAEFRQKRVDTAQPRVNWFDRRVGFPRWIQLLRQARGARLDPIDLPTVPSRSTINVSIPVTPLRRGKLIFTEVDLKKPDPFGIFYAVRRLRVANHVVSLPKRYRLPPITWISERHFHRGGLTLATAVGDSEEFMGLRDYRPGDPLRHIHWRSFAKRGEPVVKEHEDEYFDRHALILDTFLDAQSSTDFEAAISVAASLIQGGSPQDSILDFVLIEQQVWRLTTGRGLSDNLQILTHLADLGPSAEDDFEYLSAHMRRNLDHLASIVMVCCTWDEKRQRFIEMLRGRHVRCLAICVSSAISAESTNLVDVNRVRSSEIEQDLASAFASPL